MDKWELALAKIRQCELDLEQLDERYRRDKNALKEEWNLYGKRRSQFNYMIEQKYQEGIATFREEGITDYQEFNNLLEILTVEGESAFNKAFWNIQDKMDNLEQAYRKSYNQIDERLSEAYKERNQADLELSEKERRGLY